MPLVQIKVIEGVLSANQKRQIAEGVAEAIVAVEGESMRSITWVLVEEICSGDWSVGGRSLTTDDLKAMAAASA